MALRVRDIKIESKLPEIPRSMPVFKVKAASLDDRKKAINVFSKQLKLGKLNTITMEDALLFVSKMGEVQYYRPSGALWVRNAVADEKFKDEKRPWKTVKVPDEEDRENFTLALTKTETSELAKKARSLFAETKLLGKGFYFAGVSLDQIAQLDEKGEEIGRFAGEATVRFLYKLKGVEVDGAGAKSYAYFNPSRNKHELVGVFHAWRETVGTQAVQTVKIDEAIDVAITKDRELSLYHERKHKIRLTKMDLVYYSLPPFMFQEYVFPALRVIGSVSLGSAKKKNQGFEFARYFHVAPAKAYAKANLYADYLVTPL